MDDDDSAIVLDIGSSMVRAGFAGEDCPNVNFPTVIGRARVHPSMRDSKPRDAYIGDYSRRYEHLYHLTYPVDRGIVTDWDDMEILLSHTLHNELRIDPTQYPVLCSEPLLNPKRNREQMCETMFESLGVPAFYVQISAILSMYASGRGSGVMLNSGDGVTHILPIYEGYMMRNAIQRMDIAGTDLTLYLARLLSRNGHSFVTSWDLEQVKNIKEDLCYVCQDYLEEIESAKQSSAIKETYTLPDGRVVAVGSERFQTTEALFSPVLIGSDSPGFHELLYDCVMKCDIDTRRDICVNIILSGGNTMMPGFPQRLQKEFSRLMPPTLRIRPVAAPERKYNVWIGGSIVASLGAFRQAWITRAEYEEHGSRIVHRKCL